MELSKDERKDIIDMLEIIKRCVAKDIYNDRLELTGALKDVIDSIWRE